MPPEGAAPLSIPAAAVPAAKAVGPPPQNLIPVAPPAKPLEKKVEAPAAVIKGKVTSVRIGDHKDKTRIVIESDQQLPANAMMSANGKQIILDLQGWGWIGATEWLADNSMLVAAWEFKDQSLLIDVIYKTQIKSQQIIAPNGKPGYRLVIDVVSPDVHQ
jgi:hypothetical protein